MAEKENLLSDDELRHLSPEERIRYFRDLEARRRQQLEDEKERIEEEIRETSEKIRETEEEMDEQIVLARERELRELQSRLREERAQIVKQEEEEEERLEEILGAGKIAKDVQEQLFPQYKDNQSLLEQLTGSYRGGKGSEDGGYKLSVLGDQIVDGYSRRRRESERGLYQSDLEGGSKEDGLYSTRDSEDMEGRAGYNSGYNVGSGTSGDILKNLYKR